MTHPIVPGAGDRHRPDGPSPCLADAAQTCAAAPAPACARRLPQVGDDRGMTTAEYAVGTVAACGFGAVLYKAVTSDSVGRLLRGVIEQALSVSFL